MESNDEKSFYAILALFKIAADRAAENYLKPPALDAKAANPS